MLLSNFIVSLVKDAIEAYAISVLKSEEMRKQHYVEEDGILKHKHTKREHPNGEVHEVPEKTQHNTEDFLVEEMELETKVDVYSRRNKVFTSVKQKLFRRHPNVKIKLKLGRVPPSEGVSAHLDSLNEDLKEKI